MGKKSTPKMPEPYDLQELMKYNTDLNRFDSVNPFGSQTWATGDDGRMTMTQDINPQMQGLLDQQFSFVNQGATPYEQPQPMQDMMQALMDKRAALSGATPGYAPDVPATSSPRPQVSAVTEAFPPVPEAQPEQTVGQRMAAGMGAMNDGQGYQVGQGGYGAGSAMGAAIPAVKAMYDKIKRDGE